jgi:hypothetical protein
VTAGGETWRENFKHAPKGTGRPENITAYNEQQRIVAHSDDPGDVTEQLYREASKAALAWYRKVNRARSGDNPPRIIVELSREARQLAEAYERVLRARGATAEAAEFLAAMEARLAAGEVNLGERLQPYMEEPA